MLLPRLRNVRMGWLGLDIMEIVPEKVTNCSCRGDYPYCFHATVEVWASIVKERWGVLQLDVLLWESWGRDRYLFVKGWQKSVVVVWLGSLKSTFFCSSPDPEGDYLPSSSHLLIMMGSGTRLLLWPSPEWFLLGWKADLEDLGRPLTSSCINQFGLWKPACRFTGRFAWRAKLCNIASLCDLQ